MSRRGLEVPIQATVAPIRDRAGQTAGAVIVFSDVSRERRMKRLLSYQAAHDALTGLINRREFESRLNNAIESARADKNVRHAMIYVDLDQFKVVNDTCGHPAGDQLLRQVTGLLQTRVRANDVLARLGGDEFGVLLEHCTPDQALRIADTLRQSIHDLRFQWGTNTMQIGASIGIVRDRPATPRASRRCCRPPTSPATRRRTAAATACRSTTRRAPRRGTARCAGWRA